MVIITKSNSSKKYFIRRRVYLQDLKIKKKLDGGHYIAILLSEDKFSAFSFTYSEALDVFVKQFEMAITRFEIDRDALINSTKKQIEERYGIGSPTDIYNSDSNASMSSLKNDYKESNINLSRMSFKQSLTIRPVILQKRRRSNTESQQQVNSK
eukprot:NODE_61_length_25240_cov_0.547194.p13 type:complete len:154 gc:universal NODE_61_length_25240_cov_0.547194:14133-13672(-)